LTKKMLAVNNPVKAQSSATHSEELRYTITEKLTARKIVLSGAWELQSGCPFWWYRKSSNSPTWPSNRLVWFKHLGFIISH